MNEGARLHKALADLGLGSRREIEGWIEAGRVTVNGRRAVLGQRIARGDRVAVDGKPVRLPDAEPAPIRVIVYNKPEGEICSRRDPEGRPTVFAALPRLRDGRWIIVGRLDLNTTGLLLATDSGELANRLMHPGSSIEREYLVRVLGDVDAALLARLRAGVLLDDGMAAFDGIRELEGEGSNRWFTVVLRDEDPSLLGVLLSHPHLDHFGLIEQTRGSVPLYVGQAAAAILREAAFFSPSGLTRTPAGHLRHREPFTLGPFTITPYLNDHSAFDAYSLLVEADDRALFYTGDFRAHGRKAALFQRFLQRPPAKIDVLLMEGTHVRPDGEPEHRGASEADVEHAFRQTCVAASGLVLAMFSPQNIDRLVSVYKATIAAGRDLVIDLYTAAIAAATGRAMIPQAHWDRVRVYLPQAQRAKVIQTRAFERVAAVRSRRIYGEELAARRGELTMLFRASMGRELASAGCLGGATAIWSMWPGYLREPSGVALTSFLADHAIPLAIHHASGHAFIADLQRLVAGLAPAQVVPIHSFATDRFAEFFPRVDRKADGQWWDV